MIEQQHPPVTLGKTAVQELASHLRGTLIRRGDAGDEQARAVYNGMIDKLPDQRSGSSRRCKRDRVQLP